MRPMKLFWKIQIGNNRLDFLSLFFVLFFFFACAPKTLAFSVHWLPPNEKIEAGKTSHLRLLFEDCSPQEEVKPPKVDFLELGDPVVSQESRSQLIYEFPIIAQKPGNYVIPPFLIATDHGLIEAPPMVFKVNEEPLVPFPTEAVDARVILPQGPLWIGEPFAIEYRIVAHSGTFLDITSQPEWNPQDFLANRWGKPQRIILNSNGTYASGLRYTTTLLPLKSGKIVLPSITQQLTLEIERLGHGLFSQPLVKSIRSSTEPKTIDISPLPVPAPRDFSEAIGNFKLSCKLNPIEVMQGEPISLTIKIEGMGNWAVPWKLKDFPECKGLRIINSKPFRQIDPESLFNGVLKMELVLIPDIYGEVDIPPYSFTYFDITQGEYQTLKSDPIHISIKKSPFAKEHGENKQNETADHSPYTYTNPGYPQEMMPIGPLQGTKAGLAPFSPFALGKEALLLTSLFLVLWSYLSWERATGNPLINKRKKARLSLKATADSLAKVKTNLELYKFMLQWQQAFKEFWEIPHALPDEDVVEKQLTKLLPRNLAMVKKWTTLWRESQLCLYSPSYLPSSKWINDAQELARKLPRVKTPIKEIFSPSNLFPFLCFGLLAAFFVIPLDMNQSFCPADKKNPKNFYGFSPCLPLNLNTAPSPFPFHFARSGLFFFPPLHFGSLSSFSSSDEAHLFYQNGDFSKAAEAWKKKALHQPLDWKTRNNLGLVFAQQEQWAKAMGEWTAAFLLAPRDPVVSWNFNLGLSKNPQADMQLLSLSKKDYLNKIKVFFSPGEWERMASFSLLFVFFSLGLMLLSAYHKIRIPSFILMGLLLISSLSCLSFLGFFSYGIFTDSRSGIIVQDSFLRSVPTEIQQQNLPVKAGSVVKIKKTYLGWYMIEFVNGQQGWLKAQNIILFYIPPYEMAHPKEKSFYLSSLNP
ncbi:TPR repeats containing protein [Methylacidiphilum infernorum V4]|uniref:TPR repeats containing protein n=2 Tax=Candidatus Methylacidiphilum infernorum TaxID=511746 RepID=B3E134_METI4|nr:TPR repeats containing protein [Methylacidiphilum infernorum V4]